jgi:DnaJ-class molecular chaperone
MNAFDRRTYYDILEIAPGASMQEIHDAYARAKSAFNKDSAAVYSLMSEAETEGVVKEIEEAFAVLSQAAARREYDARNGIQSAAPEPSNVVPIHRIEPTRPAPQPEGSASLEEDLKLAIESETEWNGEFLKRVRETRKISKEDLANYVKITKTYLTAIEAEDFARLPAAVFVRGFITQIARYLRLPQDKVVSAYMARHKRYESSREP